jgi:predicted phosphodiesterase
MVRGRDLIVAVELSARIRLHRDQVRGVEGGSGPANLKESHTETMKTAIISDIHGNLEALEAVLADIDAVSASRIVCLGDLVGYGPDPEAVVSRVAERGITCLLGNHEAALFSEKELGWLNFLARENNIATKALLSDKSLAYCAGLARSLSSGYSSFVHGCPPDSILTYLYKLSDPDILGLAETLPEQRFFVGHTHDLQLISIDQQTVVREKLAIGCRQLDDNKKYFINVGSVGSPRDGSSAAKYVVWDSGDGSLEVRGVPYAAELTAQKILDRGFPRAYALSICPPKRSNRA